jgi:hypothetical protein
MPNRITPSGSENQLSDADGERRNGDDNETAQEWPPFHTAAMRQSEPDADQHEKAAGGRTREPDPERISVLLFWRSESC